MTESPRRNILEMYLRTNKGGERRGRRWKMRCWVGLDDRANRSGGRREADQMERGGAGLLAYRSLLTGLDFLAPLPDLGTSVHISFTFSSTLCRKENASVRMGEG